MSIKEAIEILENFCKENNIAISFSHFTKPVTPPYLTYIVPSTDNFNADNVVYQGIQDLEVELYTRVDTLETESLLEKCMTESRFNWDKTSQTWLDEDKVLMTIYTLGDFLNG